MIWIVDSFYAYKLSTNADIRIRMYHVTYGVIIHYNIIIYIALYFKCGNINI